ncbi:Ankyrin domain protein [Aspergillus flavus]|nr:Ankyrin domain protein [Aspergillus flavus]RAQ66366.1 Ankyrin domain protein [Aspergillus flavus]
MGAPHEEIQALKRRREQNRLAQRRRRDNVRRRLRDLGLDTGSPASASQTSLCSSTDSRVTLNPHQSLRSTDFLSFETSNSDTEMSPYDPPLQSKLRLDSQIPLAEISFPSYASSVSPSSSAGPLSSSPSPSQRPFIDSTDLTSLHSVYNPTSLAVHLDESSMPCGEAEIPTRQDSNFPRTPNLKSLMSGCNDPSAYQPWILTSSTVGEQMSSQALPHSPGPQHCSTPLPAETRPRWTTALHMAVSQGNFSVMRLLLSYGADPNAVNSEGATALHVGVMNGNYTMVAELLQRGADPTLTNAAGWLPLHQAVHAGDEGCVRVLLEADQPVDYPISDLDYT